MPVKIEVAHAGLDQCRPADRIDPQHALHAGQRDDDAAASRHCAAGEPGPGAASNHRHAVLPGKRNNGRDFLSRPRKHDRERALASGFDGYVEKPARVSSTCLVSVARNRYSVPCELAGQAVSTRLYPGKIVIVAGFQGQTSEENITTLGRGGSDTSAVAVAAALAFFPRLVFPNSFVTGLDQAFPLIAIANVASAVLVEPLTAIIESDWISMSFTMKS